MMQIYRVGGSVRDEILGYPHNENDWVVVGANKAQLIAQGFKEVGRGFPVFLHPKTKEEYALARKELSTGNNYRDFICETNNVSLEEDLSRRDLTINAMAIDINGNLIDPFNGKKDIETKCLRHVSTAFIEDPVRVLRVARFAARYHHLGFSLAPETAKLIYSMACNNILKNLTAERVWQEWQKSLTEKNPEQFILILRQTGALKYILPEIDCLFGIPQQPKYHPEIDTGVHTINVLKTITALTTNPILRFAACIHDLGKAITPITQWPQHKEHGILGLEPIKSLCKRLKVPNKYLIFAALLSQYHIDIHEVFNLSATQILQLFKQTKAFQNPTRFYELLLACEADSKNGSFNKAYPAKTLWEKLLNATINIKLNSYDNLSAEEIINKLTHLQLQAIDNILQSF